MGGPSAQPSARRLAAPMTGNFPAELTSVLEGRRREQSRLWACSCTSQGTYGAGEQPAGPGRAPGRGEPEPGPR